MGAVFVNTSSPHIGNRPRRIRECSTSRTRRARQKRLRTENPRVAGSIPALATNLSAFRSWLPGGLLPLWIADVSLAQFDVDLFDLAGESERQRIGEVDRRSDIHTDVETFAQ